MLLNDILQVKDNTVYPFSPLLLPPSLQALRLYGDRTITMVKELLSLLSEILLLHTLRPNSIFQSCPSLPLMAETPIIALTAKA